MSTCAACSAPISRINGRTIRDAIKKKGSHPHWCHAKIHVKRWFTFCETCDAEKLRQASDRLPYLCHDGVMRTLSDPPNAPVVALGILKATINALYSAIEQNYHNDSGITELEAKGRAYRHLSSVTVDDSLEFSAAVCRWGDGGRVLGNLKRHNPGLELGRLVHHWLTRVPALGPLDAVKLALTIKGLSVSFASKHLRHLEPNRFAVLDDVLSRGLGFATNPAGYQFFIDQLTHLRDQLMSMGEPQRTLAEIEAGIFLLARQQVRSDEDVTKGFG